MKLVANGNVLVFPAPRGGNRADADDAGQSGGPADANPGDAFLEALQASVSSAENLIEATESEQQGQDSPDDEQSGYEDWVDFGFFGTLLGRVEAKYQEICSAVSEANGANQVETSGIDGVGENRHEGRSVHVLTLVGRFPDGSEKLAKLDPFDQGDATVVLAFDQLNRANGGNKQLAGKSSEAITSSISSVTVSDVKSSASTEMASSAANASHGMQGMNDPANTGDENAPARKSLMRALASAEAHQTGEAKPPGEEETLRISESGVSSSGASGVQAASAASVSGAQTPAAQIANNILQAMPTLSRPLTSGVPDFAKSFRFKLHPEELGQVGVSLKIQGSKMVLVLSADEAAAADMLEADKEKLKVALAQAGSGIDLVEVSIVLASSETTASREPVKPHSETALQTQQNLMGGHSNGSQRQRGMQSNRAWDFRHEDGTVNVSRAVRDVTSDRRTGIYL